MNATVDGAAPISGADDDRHLALGRARRRERRSGCSSLLAQLAFPDAQVWGDVAAVGRSRRRATRGASSRAHADRGSIIGAPGTDFLWAGGRLARRLARRTRTRTSTRRVQDSKVETLLIGGDLDFATPPQNATRRAPAAPAERPPGRPARASATPTTSGATSRRRARTWSTPSSTAGRVDASLYTPQPVDFTPGVHRRRRSPRSSLAVAARPRGAWPCCSLLWLRAPRRAARRLRPQDQRRAAVALRRSCSASAAGSLGALLVLTALPTVPLDDEALAALSVGAPGRPRGLRRLGRHSRAGRYGRSFAGFAAALAGALVGAWLGFHAAPALLAPITAIVGATAAANLGVLALDIHRDRGVRRRVATATARVSLEAPA